MKSNLGFTLIELLITLSIAAVLLMFVVPIGRDFLLKNTISARTEEIVSALHYARHQAELTGETLILTPQPQGWASGMLLFVDKNGNHDYDESDQLLFQWQWDETDFSLRWQGLYDDYLLFTPTGLNSVLGGTFYLCPLNETEVNGKDILMNRLGRIRVEEEEKTCHT